MTTPRIEELPESIASVRSVRPYWMERGGYKDLDVEKYDLHDGRRPVIGVHVVANEMSGWGPSGMLVPMAHFRIFLVLDEGNPASVEIDLRGVGDTRTAKLLVLSHNWIASRGKTSRKLSDIPIPSVPGRVRTVDDVLNFLIYRKRHRYMLHESGGGCRYWTTIVLGDLIAFGVLAPGSDNVVAEAMEPEIALARPDMPMLPNIQGQFLEERKPAVARRRPTREARSG